MNGKLGGTVRPSPDWSIWRANKALVADNGRRRAARASFCARMRSRLAVSPKLYARISSVALAALALIVVTGAAVRLTGSGLGCPDWPKCYGQVVAPLEFHAVVEYGNRLITGFVGLVVIAASVLAWFRRP